jgi:hypothetical protein
LINDADEEVSEEEKKLSSAVLTEKILRLTKKQHHASRLTAQGCNRLEGEVIGAYWTAINKPKKLRDIILRLKINPNTEETPKYETNSKRMATMACDYHDKIQSERTRVLPQVREEKIRTVLNRITRKVKPEQAESLKNKLTLEDIQYALRKSANSKAPGLDGIVYEVWKILDQRYKSFKATNRPTFDVLGTLLRVYNDIQKFSMVEGTHFSESWMCTLYKKNDKSEIANYRPISLLNTDYKIFTKALAIKLTKVAPDLIHSNQAGFIPGCQIKDQIWLTKRVIQLANMEPTEDKNGVIVLLDQEKVYDKIEHDYLRRALGAYEIPKEYIH